MRVVDLLSFKQIRGGFARVRLVGRVGNKLAAVVMLRTNTMRRPPATRSSVLPKILTPSGTSIKPRTRAAFNAA
jgi:hypothetical protein